MFTFSEVLATHELLDTADYSCRVRGRRSPASQGVGKKEIGEWRRARTKRDDLFRYEPGLFDASVRHAQEKATILTRKLNYVSIFTYAIKNRSLTFSYKSRSQNFIFIPCNFVF